MPQTCLSSESHTHNCSLTALICKVTALILTGGVCLGKVSGVPGHFLKAPAVLPHCGIMINFSTTSPRKSLFSFCSLYLRFLLEEKIGTDQTRSDQTVGLPSVDMSNSVPVVKLTIFPKRIHCIDMSNSLPVVKLSARPRNSQGPLNQMWCVEYILLVGYFNFFVFVELNSPSQNGVMNKPPHPPQFWHPGWWWPSSRSSSWYRWLFSSCFAVRISWTSSQVNLVQGHVCLVQFVVDSCLCCWLKLIFWHHSKSTYLCPKPERK